MSVPSKFYDFVDDSEALRLFAQPIVFFLSLISFVIFSLEDDYKCKLVSIMFLISLFF